MNELTTNVKSSRTAGLHLASYDTCRRALRTCGVLGPVMLIAYFTAPLFAPPLARVLYSSHATTAAVVATGRRYHELLYAGTWLQATGALLSVIFLLALADSTRGNRNMSGCVLQVGAGTLLAIVLAEALFNLTWASAAVNGEVGSSRTSFDLMSSFIRIYPLIPAPMIYISVGILLTRSDVLPRAYAQLALILGVAFALCGIVSVLLPAASVATAGLAGVQALWVLATALRFPKPWTNASLG